MALSRSLFHASFTHNSGDDTRSIGHLILSCRPSIAKMVVFNSLSHATIHHSMSQIVARSKKTRLLSQKALLARQVKSLLQQPDHDLFSCSAFFSFFFFGGGGGGLIRLFPLPAGLITLPSTSAGCYSTNRRGGGTDWWDKGWVSWIGARHRIWLNLSPSSQFGGFDRAARHTTILWSRDWKYFASYVHVRVTYS